MTSARSPFWLTEKLGRTSHPTLSVARGAMETVKHPSPSTYPEMYAERNSRLLQGPASDRTHRFSPPRRTTEHDLTSKRTISRYGVNHKSVTTSHGITLSLLRR